MVPFLQVGLRTVVTRRSANTRNVQAFAFFDDLKKAAQSVTDKLSGAAKDATDAAKDAGGEAEKLASDAAKEMGKAGDKATAEATKAVAAMKDAAEK